MQPSSLASIDLLAGVHDAFVGTQILVTLTYVNFHGRPRHHSQLHGVVEAIAPALVVRIAGSAESLVLPPVARRAAPGSYRIRATGEDVTDPTLLAEWTIHERRRHDAATARRLRSAALRRERRREKRPFR